MTEKNCRLGFLPQQFAKKAFTLAEVLITLVVIGVVAAFTVPLLMQSIKKQEVETKLKYSYSLLNQVVKRAQVDYGDMTGWDYTLTPEDFAQTYFYPYVTKELSKDYANRPVLTFTNGMQWTLFNDNIEKKAARIYIDINGKNKPNQVGRDRFNFYLIPQKVSSMGLGSGTIMLNVPRPGIYYDGYGFSKNGLLTNYYRGCRSFNQEADDAKYTYDLGNFCIALIAQNGWKIPDDYPLKL